MASTTPLMGLTYPAPTDTADVSYWIQQLAQAVETAAGSAWTAYTPVLTGETAPPAIGTGGTITGRWRKIGKTIHTRGQLTLGTGFTTGTGRWLISLPATAFDPLSVPGQALVNPAGTNPVGGLCIPNAGGTSVYVFAPASGTTAILTGIGQGANVTPGGIALAATGTIRWALTYESS